MFVMFHLTLVGPDGVCVEHGHDANAIAMQGHSAHQVPHGTSHGASTDHPCETPGSAHCCDAVNSCAVTLAVAERATAPFVAMECDGPPSVAVRQPLSRSVAPEPPPPKA